MRIDSDLPLHVAHDAAMVWMSIQMDVPMEPAAMLNDPFCGTSPPAQTAIPPPMHHTSGFITGFMALVAVVSAIQAFRSKNKSDALHFTLMSAAMAAMALEVDSHVTISLMVAHGAFEGILGMRQLLQGFQPDCDRTKARGLARVFHGVCLASAQGLPYLAPLLYLAMSADTAAQLAISRSGFQRVRSEPVKSAGDIGQSRT